MLALSGYKLGRRIHETSHSEVYAATRLHDGLKVVVKIYPQGSSDPQRSRAQREFELLCRIDAPGVVRAVEVQHYGDRLALVVERFPGFPLSGYVQGRKLSYPEFLTIACQITESLALVHDARIVHKDLKLSNILLDPERQRTCLIDFGIAAEFGRAESSTFAGSAEGTLRYIAPEQTGRMGLGVDFRTDLYSLGATFYELLTGQPPFEGKDAVQLIHAHIAQRPVAPAELNPEIPLALSRIIEKLLEKDPEQRYQTARGLQVDLERCLEQITTRGEIAPDLPLGTQDASDRLRFAQQVVGREREQTALREAFERTVCNQMELVLLAGPPGIGKSSLPGLLRERLVQTDGYLASAKFDRDGRDRPYVGFAGTFTSLVDQILTERGDRLQAWREELIKGLGAIGGVLLPLAPNLEYVVEEFPALAPLGAAEAKERVALAVCRFVRVFAQPAHPLVLFFDDLQWTDPGSLFLLEALLRSGEPQALLIIGSYRDNEVDERHPLSEALRRVQKATVPTQTLTIEPLTFADVNAIVAAALGRDPVDTEWLSRRICLKSQCNPLLVRRLLLHLWERDLLRYEHGRGWVWSEEQLTEAEITDDAAAMLVHKIHSIEPGARELLKLASLVGDDFDVEGLVELSGTDRLDLLQQLMALTEAGFVAPCREGFKFVHDRLREAAQSLIAESERKHLHHRMAQMWLGRTPSSSWAERALEVVDHLRRAIDLLSETERQHALSLHVAAGRRSLSSGSASSAERYLAVGRELLRESDWQRDPAQIFSLFIASAEAAYQLRELEKAEELLSRLDAFPLSFSQQIMATAKRINVLTETRTRTDAALDLTLACLRRLGLRLPKQPSWLRVRLAIWRTDRLLHAWMKQPAFKDADRDGGHFARLSVLTSGGPSMHAASPGLICLVTAYSVRSQSRHGTMSGPAFGVAAYAQYRMRFLGDLSYNVTYAKAVEAWSAARPHPRDPLPVWSTLRGWSVPRPRVAEELLALMDRLSEVGEVIYRTYALVFAVGYLISSGEPLAAVFQKIDPLVSPEKARGSHRYLEISLGLYRLLLNDDGAPIDFDRDLGVDSSALALDAVAFIQLHRTTVLCISGDFRRAVQEAEAVASFDLFSRGAPVAYLADYAMFRGIAHAVLAGSGEGSAYASRRILGLSLRQLRRWSPYAPDVVHMQQFLTAETARLRGKHAKALKGFQDCAQRARERGYRHHAALAHERRADLLQRIGRETEASLALDHAIALYDEWGAHAKVRQLAGSEPSSRGSSRRS